MVALIKRGKPQALPEVSDYKPPGLTGPPLLHLKSVAKNRGLDPDGYRPPAPWPGFGAKAGSWGTAAGD